VLGVKNDSKEAFSIEVSRKAPVIVEDEEAECVASESTCSIAGPLVSCEKIRSYTVSGQKFSYR
jgi:hypothetical protein